MTRARFAAICVTAGLLLVLSGCGGGSSTSTAKTTPTAVVTARLSATPSQGANGVVNTTAGGVTATMHASTPNPRVEAPWPIGFTVTRGGRPVQASVSYEYLFAGQVVARRSHYVFTGHFSDVFHWPATAVGYPLTFRAVIVPSGVSAATPLNLDYPVQVGR